VNNPTAGEWIVHIEGPEIKPLKEDGKVKNGKATFAGGVELRDEAGPRGQPTAHEETR